MMKLAVIACLIAMAAAAAIEAPAAIKAPAAIEAPAKLIPEANEHSDETKLPLVQKVPMYMIDFRDAR